MSTTTQVDLAVAGAAAICQAEADLHGHLQQLESLSRSASPTAHEYREFLRFQQLLRAAVRVLNDEGQADA